MAKFTFIDLFSGIGGFKMALSDNGGKCLGFSEIAKDAIKCYCENFSIDESKNFGTITKIDGLPKHDMLTAGVPCQSWSIAGRNLGFDDDRGQLWNDTIYLLQKSKPKAFIFENVKGLVDPRNKEALNYIMNRIREAGYHANYHVLNSFNYGVPQNRVRIYIVGFKQEKYFKMFVPPAPVEEKITLADSIGVQVEKEQTTQDVDLFGARAKKPRMSLSTTNGFNDYFLFNDIRNGETTLHSWDLLNTTDHQKQICMLILRNRRKSKYGRLDGNPLSLDHLRELDNTIGKSELKELIELGVLKEIEYKFEILDFEESAISEDELFLLSTAKSHTIALDELKLNKELRKKKISFAKALPELLDNGVIKCIEKRYDFKNTKISSGLFGVNRIFLPTSDVFSTLVASDTNDFVTPEILNKGNHDQFREEFIENVYRRGNYRRITKEEACRIQGFPADFKLPEARNRWMKLVGNSVSVPVIDLLCKSIVRTGVFD